MNLIFFCLNSAQHRVAPAWLRLRRIPLTSKLVTETDSASKAINLGIHQEGFYLKSKLNVTRKKEYTTI